MSGTGRRRSKGSFSAISTLIRKVQATGVSLAVVAPRLFFESLLNPVVLGPVKSQGILRYPLRAGFPVSFHSLAPEAFGEMIVPLFGAGAAAGVVAGYQAQASANAIKQQTSAQHLLGLTPRTLEQWLTEISA